MKFIRVYETFSLNKNFTCTSTEFHDISQAPTYRLSLLSRPLALSHRKPRPPGHTVIAAVLRDTIKGTLVLEFRTLQLLAFRGSNYVARRDFPFRPDWPRGLPSLLYNSYQVLPGGKVAGGWY